MTSPPRLLDGAIVLKVADLADTTRTNRTLHVAGGHIPAPVALAIARYETEQGIYLFYCDRDWKVLSDTLHESEREAIEQAEFEFGGALFVSV